MALPSKDLQHYEVRIYEGESLPKSATTGGLRVTHRHSNADSAHLHADEEYAKSLAIGWLQSHCRHSEGPVRKRTIKHVSDCWLR